MEVLYTLTGKVIHGLGNGQKVHMPTANMALAPGQALPPYGVYVARVTVEGQTYTGVTNVGNRPSLGIEDSPTIETYLLDFSGDLYGKEISVQLLAYLRPTRKMPSLSAVQNQVMKDTEAARALLG